VNEWAGYRVTSTTSGEYRVVSCDKDNDGALDCFASLTMTDGDDWDLMSSGNGDSELSPITSIQNSNSEGRCHSL
jgi:hypothetical protein